VVEHPAGCGRPLPRRGAAPKAFRLFDALGTRNGLFVAASSTAHSLACLRFAGDVTATDARLATVLSGLTQVGRASHPLDDRRGFAKSSHSWLLPDQPCLVATKDWFPGTLPIQASGSPDRWNDGLMTVEVAQYPTKNLHQLDVAFRLAENDSIVLLHGGGVHAPDWPLRVSLADPTDDVCDGTGRGTRSVTRAFEAS
jgi:hypothetical protein